MALGPNLRKWCNSEVESKGLCQGRTTMELDSFALNGELDFAFEVELAFSD